MYDVFASALPEFLGSLSAGLVIAVATWTARKLRARRTQRIESAPPAAGHTALEGGQSDVASRPYGEAR
ncbi:hypothetical protein [Streptomyces sp. NPDC000961]|uniref:hypothetical protein n=1 Tax=Streptomyces sp. NPDC000961 TaxID=3364541 RepID=UPI00368EF225